MKQTVIKIFVFKVAMFFGLSFFLNLKADVCQNLFSRMNLLYRLESSQESLSPAEFLTIEKLLETEGLKGRERIVELLSKRQDSAADDLLAKVLIKDKEASIRLLAAQAIEKRKASFWLDDLEAAFNDVDPVVQQFVKDAVKRGLPEVLEKIAENIGVTKASDWYEVSAYDLREELSEAQLGLFGGSVSEMIMELVPAPEGGWLPWEFGKVSKSFWDIEENQKKYMEWLGERLGYTKPEDWYGLTQRMIKANSGSGLLQQKFRGSPAEMVMALVEAAEGGWKPWQFSQVPDGFWDDKENQKAYMKWLGERLGYTKPEDWYQLTTEMIKENSGRGLLANKFRNSPAEMVMAALVDEAPEGGWLPWKFSQVSKSFWDIEGNQKAYMKWLGEKLGFRKPEDWYGLTGEMIRANSGGGLLQHKFRGSPAVMVMALEEAPEGGWLPWLFTNAPNGFWDIVENRKKYMKWLGEKLGFSTPKDWYGLTGEMIRANSGSELLTTKFNGSVSEMVMALEEAPEGGWVREKFGRSTQPEALMLESLAKWFRDFRTESASVSHGLKWHTGVSMEADVLFEDLKFVIEYHGEQHYKPVEGWGGQEVFEMIQKRDQEKREAFKNAGYIYIEIPHFKWAGGSEAVLKNLILEQLQEYEASSDPEVKARAGLIEQVLREILSR